MRHPWIITAAVALLVTLMCMPASAGADGYDLNEISAGIPANGSPRDVVLDAHGRAWFTIQGTGADALGVALDAKTAAGAQVIGIIPMPAGSQPRSLVLGFDNDIWFTEPGTNSIGRIDPDNTSDVTHYSLGTTAPLAAPLDIAKGLDIDPALGLWFTEPGVGKVGRIRLDGSVVEFDTGIGAPGEIARGPDGLYFSKPSVNRIGRIDMTGFVTEVTTSISPGAAPGDLVAGQASTVWFTEPGVNMLGRVTSGGANVVTEFPLPFGTPTMLLAVNSNEMLISRGPGDRISRRDSAGNYADLPFVPTPGSVPNAMVPGIKPDTLWFTEPGAGRIAYVAPTPAPPPPPTPDPEPVKPKRNPNLDLELESSDASPVTLKASPKSSKKKATKPRRCYVPKLKLRTVKGTKRLLVKNRCRIGKITRKGGKSRPGLRFRVIKQSRKVHTRVAYRAKVNITVAPRKAPPKPKKKSKK